jgi:hypothetical protein
MKIGPKTWEWVVAAVLAAAAVAILVPLALHIREKARRADCMNNMRNIDSSVLTAAMEFRIAVGQHVPEVEVRRYLRPKIFICPSGGHYTIPSVGEYPSCSVHGTAEHWKSGDREHWLETGLANRLPGS